MAFRKGYAAGLYYRFLGSLLGNNRGPGEGRSGGFQFDHRGLQRILGIVVIISLIVAMAKMLEETRPGGDDVPAGPAK